MTKLLFISFFVLISVSGCFRNENFDFRDINDVKNYVEFHGHINGFFNFDEMDGAEDRATTYYSFSSNTTNGIRFNGTRIEIGISDIISTSGIEVKYRNVNFTIYLNNKYLKEKIYFDSFDSYKDIPTGLIHVNNDISLIILYYRTSEQKGGLTPYFTNSGKLVVKEDTEKNVYIEIEADIVDGIYDNENRVYTDLGKEKSEMKARIYLNYNANN